VYGVQFRFVAGTTNGDASRIDQCFVQVGLTTVLKSKLVEMSPVRWVTGSGFEPRFRHAMARVVCSQYGHTSAQLGMRQAMVNPHSELN
jgi:hypothetical protein